MPSPFVFHRVGTHEGKIMIPRDYEALYNRLGRLLAEVPAVATSNDAAAPATQLWLGRAYALVEAVGVLGDDLIFRSLSSDLHSGAARGAFARIVGTVYRAFGVCEGNCPPALAGTFLPVGSPHDAHTAIGRIVGQARADVFFVDPYGTDELLRDFATAVPEGVSVRVLVDREHLSPALAPASVRWRAQYGSKRPLDVRVSARRALHDRAMFVDGATAWTVSQSFKDLAKRSPAEIIRVNDIAPEKLAAYGDIWDRSAPVPQAE